MDNQIQTNIQPGQAPQTNTNVNSSPGSQPAPVISPRPKKSMMAPLLILLFVVLIAGAVYGAYYWQHGKLNSADQKVANLTSQVNSLKGQVQKLENGATTNQPSSSTSANSAQSSSSTSTTQSTLKISTLGIEVSVPSTLSGLTYSETSKTPINGEPNITVGLSTTSLTKSDPGCAASDEPLGTLSKTNGQYPKNASVGNSSGVLVKQFSGYYIAYNSPQAACSSKTSVQNTQQLDKSALKFSDVQVLS